MEAQELSIDLTMDRVSIRGRPPVDLLSSAALQKFQSQALSQAQQEADEIARDHWQMMQRPAGEETKLRVVDHKGRSWVLCAEAGAITVGRSSKADIVLNSKAVSGIHAGFLYDAEKDVFSVQDWSKMGSFINGEHFCGESRELQGGETLHFAVNAEKSMLVVEDVTVVATSRRANRVEEAQEPVVVNESEAYLQSHTTAETSAPTESTGITRAIDKGSEELLSLDDYPDPGEQDSEILSSLTDWEAKDDLIERNPILASALALTSRHTLLTDTLAKHDINEAIALQEKRARMEAERRMNSTMGIIRSRIQTVQDTLEDLDPDKKAKKELTRFQMNRADDVGHDEFEEAHDSSEEDELPVSKAHGKLHRPKFQQGSRVLFKHRVEGLGRVNAQGFVIQISRQYEPPKYWVKSESLPAPHKVFVDEKDIQLVDCNPSHNTKQFYIEKKSTWWAGKEGEAEGKKK